MWVQLVNNFFNQCIKSRYFNADDLYGCAFIMQDKKFSVYLNMNINNEKYTQHKVFTEIRKYADFYDSLSFSTMHFIAMGTKALNFDTYIFLSIKGTLKSISVLLSQGRINDSYTLLRKYYDSCIINAYEIAYLQEHFSIDNFIVEKINNWLKGKAARISGNETIS
jgi:hypothetical protein